jgi:hypothetical protein
MFKITTNFAPIRIIAGQKDPVILNIYIKNLAESSKMATVFIKTPTALGFDRMGLAREVRRRVPVIKENTEKTIPIVLYPRSTIKEGEYPVNIKVLMHNDRFDKTEFEYTMETKLRVV